MCVAGVGRLLVLDSSTVFVGDNKIRSSGIFSENFCRFTGIWLCSWSRWLHSFWSAIFALGSGNLGTENSPSQIHFESHKILTQKAIFVGQQFQRRHSTQTYRKIKAFQDAPELQTSSIALQRSFACGHFRASFFVDVTA